MSSAEFFPSMLSIKNQFKNIDKLNTIFVKKFMFYYHINPKSLNRQVTTARKIEGNLC